MTLLTTQSFTDLLHQQDQIGNKILTFRIKTTKYGDIIASGEIELTDIDLTLKNAQQTDEGDRDTLRIDLIVESCE